MISTDPSLFSRYNRKCLGRRTLSVSHHTIAAVPEMVRQQPRGDFRTCEAAGSASVLGDIRYRLFQEHLVANTRVFTEMLISPFEDGLDVLFGDCRYPESANRITCHRNCGFQHGGQLSTLPISAMKL